MAPLEPSATAQSNGLAAVLFAGQTLLVTALTANVLIKARRAARALPPPTQTRAQQDARRRHAIVFSVLAGLSLASVTTFAFIWRALSYLDWAETGNLETPGSLWTGWYGTGEEGVGKWRLGDWLSDTDLFRSSDEVAVAKPEAFLYTSQHFVALVASSIFMGIEGRRRNLSNSTIASFVVLSTVGSLGYALSLFFVIMLYTPMTLHSEASPRHDALFTPKPAVFIAPVLTSLFALHTLPGQIRDNKDVILLRWGYIFVPLFLAFAPQIVTSQYFKRLGKHHATQASAHRSYASVFVSLSTAAALLHWKTLGFALFANTPLEKGSVYDRFKDSIGQGRTTRSRVYEGFHNLAQKLKPVSIHPAVSVTSSDVLFAALSLLAWSFIRDLDIEKMLENNLISLPLNYVRSWTQKTTPTAATIAEIEDTEDPLPPVTPKRRGRPKKGSATPSTTSGTQAADTPALRRSTRRGRRSDYESEAEETYQPSAETTRELDQIETDGTAVMEEIVGPAESTALGFFLLFVGGLGQLAASVLGAEVTAA